jgi:putative ABC transport system ATP-binding protein
MSLLTLRGVSLRFGDARVLDAVDLDIAPAETVGIAGPSGAGKTSLLHIAGLLLRPQSGSVKLHGALADTWPEAARTRQRRGPISFIFQDFLLIPELSALENVLLPSGFAPSGPQRPRALALLDAVGIAAPGQRAGLLSRGEQQRVAIARALAGQPDLILADEPTASLDADTAALVGSLLLDQARTAGAALLAVSHDPAFLACLGRVLHLRAGRLAA